MDSSTGDREKSGRAEVSVLGLIRTIQRWRRPFFVLLVGFPLVTAVVMLLTSNKFTATGTVLVETPEGGIGSDLLGQVRAFTGLAPQVPSTDMYMAILRSERLQMAVAESLDLATHYEIEADSPEEAMEVTLNMMSKRTGINAPDLITIGISATDSDPEMAARIVNAFLNELEAANQTLALSRARRTRALVADALVETGAELDSTRKRLQQFQERYGVFSIEKQTEGTLELIRALQAELLAAQTQRDQLEGFTSEGSSRLRNLDLKIQALKTQINQLVVGKTQALTREKTGDVEGNAQGKPVESFFIPLGELPSLASEYAKLFMDLTVQQEKYRVLATQLEQTKVEESQSIPSFDILDWGRRPYRKSGPFRTLMVLASMIVGLLTSVLFVVLLEDISQRMDQTTKDELRGYLPPRIRGWLDGV